MHVKPRKFNVVGVVTHAQKNLLATGSLATFWMRQTLTCKVTFVGEDVPALLFVSL